MVLETSDTLSTKYNLVTVIVVSVMVDGKNKKALQKNIKNILSLLSVDFLILYIIKQIQLSKPFFDLNISHQKLIIEIHFFIQIDS